MSVLKRINKFANPSKKNIFLFKYLQFILLEIFLYIKLALKKAYFSY